MNVIALKDHFILSAAQGSTEDFFYASSIIIHMIYALFISKYFVFEKNFVYWNKNNVL